MKRIKVAAIIYFEDGTTLNDAKKVLMDLKKKLDNERKGVHIDHGIVDQYDPECGAPVWYIP